MKIIEVDEELYQYIASQTQSIGESASDILRRLLNFSNKAVEKTEVLKCYRKNNLMKLFSKWTAKVRELLHSESFQQENKAVVRFLNILRVLYRTNPESFAQATESLQGRTRVYFARDEGTLLMAGNQTKPKQIPDTPYWVITNTNSGRKMLMLEGAMQSMHLPADLIEEVRSYFVAN
ncbi:replication initiation negative regulator SeqA [Pasteurella multocida]|uniref:replication initiation negative regulator SeqA n=1 Tax=Pasteurella multocida TaxID=747 RepID=UPI00156D70FE|nr:replication initiation negative regulator SeqA [Pasteurella multocida]